MNPFQHPTGRPRRASSSSPRSAWECVIGRTADRPGHHTSGLNSGTQSVRRGIPTQNVGTGWAGNVGVSTDQVRGATSNFPFPFLACILASLAILHAGCTPPPATTVVPKPEAPRAPEVASTSIPSIKFVDITESAGIRFTHTNGAAGEKLLPETMGSGVAALDYDGDGDPDLLFVNSTHWQAQSSQGHPTQALYRNDGKGHFEDVTAEAGLAVELFGMGVAVGDYDNDGDPDVFLSALGGGRLFRNDGKGHFEDVTAAANASGGAGWQTSAAFFDMENDGDLDLFVCRYVDWNEPYDRGQGFQLSGNPGQRAYGAPTAFKGSFCTLLRNDGGTFVDVSESSGIQVKTPGLKDPVGKSLGVAPWDIDGDGLVDLAVANDTVPNFLFRNLGGGKFEEIGYISGVAFDLNGQARGAMGIDWADFKCDGSLGLAIGNFANEMTALYVCDDPKTLLFADLANVYGLGAPSAPPLKFGLFFFDYDNDGRPDLLSVNGHLESDIAKVQASQSYKQAAQLFWNTGRPGRNLYALVGPDSAGPDLFLPIVGRGGAYLDIDGDGDLDVVTTANGGPARLLRNDGGSEGHHFRLKLVGKASNREGIGAKVDVRIARAVQRRQNFPGKGYLSSVEPALDFGLGVSPRPDEVTVTWPSGKVTKLEGIVAGKSYVVDEEGGVR